MLKLLTIHKRSIIKEQISIKILNFEEKWGAKAMENSLQI